MSETGVAESRGGFWSSLASLATASSTLVCCAIPALMVSIGAGAVLSSFISVFPQVVWLSEHKEALFSIAALMMAGAGVMQWRNRHAPCPTEPRLRDACLRTRTVSSRIYLVSVACLAIGAWFAFVMPWLGG